METTRKSIPFNGNIAFIAILCAFLVMPGSNTEVMAQATWKKLAPFHDANSFSSLDLGDNDIVYGRASDNRIFYSSDQGESWTSFYSTELGSDIGNVRASDVSSRVFCSTTTAGLAFTDDKGVNWTTKKLNGGGGTTGFGATILDYGINGNEIAVFTQDMAFPNIQHELWVSNNNGNSFTKVSSTVPFWPGETVFIRDTLIFNGTGTDGVYVTTDLNGSWSNTGFSGQEVRDMDASGDTLYAAVVTPATGIGIVVKSTDYGQSWTTLPSYPVAEKIRDIAWNEQNNTLYATSPSGVYAYRNGSWINISQEKWPDPIITMGNKDMLFSGMRVTGAHVCDHQTDNTHHVYEGLRLVADFMEITSDNQLYYGSLHNSFLSHLDLDSLQWNVSTLYDSLPYTRLIAMDTDSGGQCVTGGLHHITRVKKGGSGLEIIADSNSAPPAYVYNDLFPMKMEVGNNGSIGMVQHANQDYVDYSPDDGQSWFRIFESGVGGHPTIFQIRKFLAGKTEHYLYAIDMAVNDILLHSPDTGNTWNALPLPDPNNRISNVAVDHENKLYAATLDSLYYWDATNNNWEAMDLFLGIASNKSVEITFDHGNNLYVLVRTELTQFSEEGVYRFEQQDSSFTKIPFPVRSGQKLSLKSLAFSKDNTPFANMDITEEGGIPATEGIYYFSDSTVSLSAKEEQFARESRLSVYPNPVKDQLHITAAGALPEDCYLIGMGGKAHLLPLRDNKVDVSELPAGIYILTFDREKGRKRVAEPVVIMK